eukprot:401821-Prymnesium_polylepis.1
MAPSLVVVPPPRIAALAVADAHALALGLLGLVLIGWLCGSRAVPGTGGRLRVGGGRRLLRTRALVAGLAGRAGSGAPPPSPPPPV